MAVLYVDVREPQRQDIDGAAPERLHDVERHERLIIAVVLVQLQRLESLRTDILVQHHLVVVSSTAIHGSCDITVVE